MVFQDTVQPVNICLKVSVMMKPHSLCVDIRFHRMIFIRYRWVDKRIVFVHRHGVPEVFFINICRRDRSDATSVLCRDMRFGEKNFLPWLFLKKRIENIFEQGRKKP